MKPGTFVFVFVAMACEFSSAQSVPDELAVQASWQIPGDAEVQRAVNEWLDESGADEAEKTAVLEQLTTSPGSGSERLDAVLDAIEVLRDEVSALRNPAPDQRNSAFSADFDFSKFLNDGDWTHSFVRNHLILLHGRWLVQNELYDEALVLLNQVGVSQVLDPAALLFYRALSEHQLLMKDECTATVRLLLENSETLPRRFRIVGELLLADIAPLEEGSLDEIARLMADIHRRQSLYRSGQRVRGQEQQVIEKLDKLIEDLESQQQQQQLSSSNQSSQPMDESKNATGRGDGTVKRTDQVDGGQWGDLPPQERAAALAEMSKDLPPHYRPVIEEYFRQLAEGRER